MMATTFDNILAQGIVKPTERPPVAVLSELASSLEEQVGYKIQFSVARSSIGNTVLHSLRLQVRRLDYVLELVTLSHDILRLYPATISGYLAQESSVFSNILEPISADVTNEAELTKALMAIFGSGKAKEIIGTLLVQAEA